MQWESTDNFGNLMIGQSEATDEVALAEDLSTLIEALFDRHEGAITLSIDISYGEIAGPSGKQVSHILNCAPFFEAMEGKGKSQAEIHSLTETLILGALPNDPAREVTIQGPWDE